MARSAGRSGPTTNASDLHRQWLELVDVEGPFLAIPPLKRVWPNGIPDFRVQPPGPLRHPGGGPQGLRGAWEALDREPDSDSQLDAYRVAATSGSRQSCATSPVGLSPCSGARWRGFRRSRRTGRSP
jgi:hypothetical protein